MTRSTLWQRWHDPDDAIRLGISACLLGQPVRYDGGHKKDRYLTEGLGSWVEWKPVCPEVELGLTVPRPTLRLVHHRPQPRLVVANSGEDLTDSMQEWAEGRVRQLEELDLDGFVLKRASPSCGMERVRVYGARDTPYKGGTGIFARALMTLWPNLPVEEEGRLNDPSLRENFIERIFVRHRWRQLRRRGGGRGELVKFHTAHKLLVRSHNEAAYRRLGRLVAAAGTMPEEELLGQYEAELFAALRFRANPKRHANVLYHAIGYLKRLISSEEKQELVETIEDYRLGLVPLIVPITLLRHHVRVHHVPYLAEQLYLEPHPKELMLRNRV